ncbi:MULTISPECIES: AAA family ATPase [Pantoea]|jgi:hypothetical protein|uniref:AAA family ATPase n=1 Tax=Pantoea TaxID=53335 RepID=UPI003AB4103E
MQIVIGIAGAHSTGKSSFCKALSDTLTTIGIRVSLVPSFGKTAYNLGMPLLKKHDYSSTLWFINKTSEEREKAMVNSEVIIVDRPEFDALAYWNAAMDFRKESHIIKEKENIEKIIIEHSQCYSYLFATKLDSLIPLAPDRDCDLDFRKSVDFHLHDLKTRMPFIFSTLKSNQHQETIFKLHSEITLKLGK